MPVPLPSRIPLPSFLALVTALAAPAAVEGQERATLRIRVTTAEAPQAPVQDAQASLARNSRSGVTAVDGRLELAGLRPGADTLVVSRVGYGTVRMPLWLFAGETREMAVALPVQAVVLAEVEVRAQQIPHSPALQEFYGRVERNIGGQFVTREQMKQRNLLRFTDLFRGLPGVQVTSGPGGETIRIPRNVASISDSDCPPMYYVDGVPYQLGGSPDREFNLNEIEGIEVYAGSSVPGRYSGSRARCGVILVWTRERG